MDSPNLITNNTSAIVAVGNVDVKFKELKAKAKNLKSQVMTIYFVSKDKRLPFHIKLIAVFCVAYSLSPIDLIPDFIPVLGLLDDLIIIPLCLALIIRLTPPEILENAKTMAEKSNLKPVNYFAGALIVCIWLSIVSFLAINILARGHYSLLP